MESKPSHFLFRLAVALASVELIVGHGTVLDPVCRQSRWRTDPTAVKNYDDVGMFCGGFYVQWQQNQGKCGLCGDNAQHPTPRAHEIGGRYGQGVITGTYKSGGVLPVRVLITANHRGTFVFYLCNLDEGPENEACFAKTRLNLVTGQDTYTLKSTQAGEYNVTLRIPPHVSCKHCVLQWTYIAGNNWGICANGRGALGCGNQEHFRSCSDITIIS